MAPKKTPDTEVTLPAKINIGNNQDKLLAMIERMATNPETNIIALERMLDMQERVIKHQAKARYNVAMLKTQTEMPIVPKDKPNAQTGSRYSSYETIMKTCSPTIAANGFTVSFTQKDSGSPDLIRVAADVAHIGGHVEHKYVDVPIDNLGPKGSPNKTKTHGWKSAVTYGRSTLLGMIFNLSMVDGDDDGNAAGNDEASEELMESINTLKVELIKAGVIKSETDFIKRTKVLVKAEEGVALTTAQARKLLGALKVTAKQAKEKGNE